jgi:glycine cleavage system protein P-like pyridoxal-binding family
MKTADFRDMLQSSPVRKVTNISKTTVASTSWAYIVMMGAAGFSGISICIHQQIILCSPNLTVFLLCNSFSSSLPCYQIVSSSNFFYSGNIKSVLLHINNYDFVKHNSEQTLRTTTIYFI